MLQCTMTDIKIQGRLEQSEMSYNWKISNLPKMGSTFFRSPALTLGNHELEIRLFVENEAGLTKIEFYFENRGLEEINLETLSLFLIGTQVTDFLIIKQHGVHFLPSKIYKVKGFSFDTAMSHFFSNGQIQIRIRAKLSIKPQLKSGNLRKCKGRTSISVDLEREFNSGNYHDAKLVK